MCLEIVRKVDQAYYLTFIPDAKAKTDCPDSLVMLLKQRRRWGNGTLFGTLHAIRHMGSILSSKTKHSCCWKARLGIFVFYYMLTFLMSLVMVGAMFATLTIFLTTLLTPSEPLDGILGWCLTEGNCGTIISVFYLFLIISCALLSILYKVDSAAGKFKVITIISGIFMIVVFLGIAYYMISGVICYYWLQTRPDEAHLHCAASINVEFLDPVILAFGLIILVAQLFPLLARPTDICSLRIVHYFAGFVSYLMMIPTYTFQF